MTRTSGLAQAPERRGFALLGAFRRPATTPSWVLTSFVVALALAAGALAALGGGDRGTAIGLKLTAMWAFLLFWPAYAGSAAASLSGPRFAGWARRGREFGLGFAAAMIVHVALVVWLYHIATEPVGAMLFFWAGVACTCILALFSLPQLRAALGPRLWRLFCAAALNYIALVFADATLIAGAGLRLAAFARRAMERPKN